MTSRGPAEIAGYPAEVAGYEFGPYRLELEGRLLYRGEEPVAITPRAVDTLVAFLEQPGRVLSKEQLLARVWSGQMVEDANLAQNVFVLRKLLGDAADGHPFIETLPRRGYRFVAAVTVLQGRVIEAPEAERRESAAPRPSAAPAPRELAAPSMPRPARGRGLGLGVMIAVLVAALAGAALWWSRSLPPPAPANALDVRTLAVLPLSPLDPAAADTVLELGLADALITRLSSVPGLIVRPTTSVMRYAGGFADAARVARDLEVDAVLEGRWQTHAGEIRLTAQLIEPRTGRTLWSGTFDQRQTDLFALEDSLSREVVAALAPKVSWTRPPSEPGTTDLEAHRLYLEGRALTLGLVHLDRAVAALERAVALDPAYAQAWSALSFAHMNSVEILAPPREAQPEARRAAERALQLNPSLPEARLVLATVAWQFDWEPARAAAEFEAVLRERPDDAVAWSHYAFFQSVLGSPEAARAAAERARSLDRSSFEVGWNATGAYVLAGDDEPALPSAREFVAKDPHGWLPHVLLGRALERLGQRSEAIRELEEARRLAPEVAEVWMDLGAVLARAGRRQEARQAIAELERLALRSYVSPFHRALVAAELGDESLASRELAQAIADRSWYVTWLRSVPQVEALRRLPDYSRLSAGLGFLASAGAARSSQ